MKKVRPIIVYILLVLFGYIAFPAATGLIGGVFFYTKSSTDVVFKEKMESIGSKAIQSPGRADKYEQKAEMKKFLNSNFLLSDRLIFIFGITGVAFAILGLLAGILLSDISQLWIIPILLLLMTLRFSRTEYLIVVNAFTTLVIFLVLQTSFVYGGAYVGLLLKRWLRGEKSN